MKLSGRRESSNVEDRRGLSGGAKAGIGGIAGIIIAAIFAYMSGGSMKLMSTTPSTTISVGDQIS